MGATSGIQGALPETAKLKGGLSRVQERAKPANPERVMPPPNGTTARSRAGFKRRSTDGTERENGQVSELTDRVELSYVACGLAGDRPP